MDSAWLVGPLAFAPAPVEYPAISMRAASNEIVAARSAAAVRAPASATAAAARHGRDTAAVHAGAEKDVSSPHCRRVTAACTCSSAKTFVGGAGCGGQSALGLVWGLGFRV